MSTRILKVRNPELKDELEAIWDNMDEAAEVGAPVAAVAATGTLTLTGSVEVGEVVVIGADTYEFVDGGEVSTVGNIAVEAGDLTAAVAATALIDATGTAAVTKVTGGSGIITVTASVKGVLANTIVTTSTSATGFATATLIGGTDGTVALAGALKFTASALYVAVEDCTISDSNWKSVAIS